MIRGEERDDLVVVDTGGIGYRAGPAAQRAFDHRAAAKHLPDQAVIVDLGPVLVHAGVAFAVHARGLQTDQPGEEREERRSQHGSDGVFQAATGTALSAPTPRNVNTAARPAR